MCDIYNDPCKICGKFVDMHLGDYSTKRFEIAIVHEKCIKDSLGINFYIKSSDIKYHTRFKTKEYGTILIFSLTKNAWKNREYNVPNLESRVKQLKPMTVGGFKCRQKLNLTSLK